MLNFSSDLLLLTLVQAAVQQVNQAVSAQDQPALLAALRLEALALLGVVEPNCHWYLEHFTTYCQHKLKVPSITPHRLTGFKILVPMLKVES